MNVCNSPCRECPFRKDSPAGWIGSYGSPFELHALVMNELPFPCHMRHHEGEVEFRKVGSDDAPFCKGALLYMRKAAKWPRNKKLANLVMVATSKEMDNILSVPEFLKHHEIHR